MDYYLIFHALVGVLVGWYLRPKDGSWKGWGVAALWAVLGPVYPIFLAVIAVLALVTHKGK